MRIVRYAVLLALASCGRLGFNDLRTTGDGGPGDGGTDAVHVVVLTNDIESSLTAPTGGGLPVAATVLVDRGTGSLQRLVTDDQGAVTLPSEGLVAYHVVAYVTNPVSGNTWQVYTVATGTTGTVQLGGIRIAPDNTMSVTLPSGGGGSYVGSMPRRCGALPQTFGSPVMLAYGNDCEGQRVRVLGFPASDTTRFVDAGMITLANGSATTVTGGFAAMPTYAIQFSNLPAGTQSVAADVLARDDNDLTALSPRSADSAAVTGTSATLTTAAAAGANTLHVTASFGRAGRAFESTSEQIAPVAFSAPALSASFDGSAMLAPFASLDFDAKLALTWTGGSGGTMIVVHLSGQGFDWDAYLPPTATSVTFPVIPGDLGFPAAPLTVFEIQLKRIEVPGATAVGLTPAIDRLARQWPDDPALLPAAGNRVTEADYLSSFVTAP